MAHKILQALALGLASLIGLAAPALAADTLPHNETAANIPASGCFFLDQTGAQDRGLCATTSVGWANAFGFGPFTTMTFPPAASMLSSNGSVFGSVGAGTGLVMNGVFPNQTVALPVMGPGAISVTNASLTFDIYGRVATASSGTTGGTVPTPANPTATIGTAPVNGTATTYMRSDAAPAMPLGSAATFGAVKVDGTTILASAGVLSVPSAGGGLSSFQIGPGLTAHPGTPNPGTETINSSSQVITGQFNIVYKSSGTAYTLTAADAGNMLIATVAGFTFTLPAVAPAGASYALGSDNVNPYTVITGSAAIFKGCRGDGSSTLTQPPGLSLYLASDGTNWHCDLVGYEGVALTGQWLAGQNLDSCAAPPCAIPIKAFTGSKIITKVSCIAETLAGGTATLDFYYQDATLGLACGGGSPGTRVKINTTACDANLAGSAGKVQNLAPANVTIPPNSKICVVPSATWATSGVGTWELDY